MLVWLVGENKDMIVFLKTTLWIELSTLREK